jgi:putative FmdB family regulatory protein
MPIWDYECKDCGHIWENIETRSFDTPKICPACGMGNFVKLITTKTEVRMDSDTILRSLPDPVPPLEELRGKTKRGCEGGYVDKPYASTNLKDYIRTRDKYGNAIWKEKRKSYFTGIGSRKSSAETE